MAVRKGWRERGEREESRRAGEGGKGGEERVGDRRQGNEREDRCGLPVAREKDSRGLFFSIDARGGKGGGEWHHSR
jgi:hypothetical protein